MTEKVIRNIGFWVDNEFGVLTRITSLLRREGVNIISLAVTDTSDPDLSRMIISIECRQTIYPRIIERLKKQVCTKKVMDLSIDFDFGDRLNAIFSQIDDFKGGFTDHE